MFKNKNITKRIIVCLITICFIVSNLSFYSLALQNEETSLSYDEAINSQISDLYKSSLDAEDFEENIDNEETTESETSYGWVLSEDNMWMLLDENGQMYTSWAYVEDQWYFFAANGIMQTDWEYIDNLWYYFNASGTMATGWSFIDGLWYYFNENGSMATGWNLINGVWYYFNASGAMLTGWGFIDNKWYLFDDLGAMQIGWRLIDNDWYYFKANGAMAVNGWYTIDGKRHHFNDKGQMSSGLQQVGQSVYYLDSSGVRQTGWQYVNDTYMFFKSNGELQSTWRMDKTPGTITTNTGETFSYSSKMIGSCTAYTAHPGALTSTGAPAQYGYVAVDPKVIPYHSELYIVSCDGSLVYGKAYAKDTGGVMRSGNRLADLFYNSTSECVNFGVRDMVIYIK
ncbi:MAG: 3D domain-containing protein [Clostridia bacterium]|nr:3D domain-containing protein [Clostridia bacterium]